MSMASRKLTPAQQRAHEEVAEYRARQAKRHQEKVAQCARLAEVGPRACQVYCAILVFNECQQFFSPVTLEEVATYLGVSVGVVRRAAKKLIRHGFMDPCLDDGSDARYQIRLGTMRPYEDPGTRPGFRWHFLFPE